MKRLACLLVLLVAASCTTTTIAPTGTPTRSSEGPATATAPSPSLTSPTPVGPAPFTSYVPEAGDDPLCRMTRDTVVARPGGPAVITSVVPDRIEPGVTFRVTGVNFQPGVEVTAVLAKPGSEATTAVLARQPADARGAIEMIVPVPVSIAGTPVVRMLPANIPVRCLTLYVVAAGDAPEAALLAYSEAK